MCAWMCTPGHTLGADACYPRHEDTGRITQACAPEPRARAVPEGIANPRHEQYPGQAECAWLATLQSPRHACPLFRSHTRVCAPLASSLHHFIASSLQRFIAKSLHGFNAASLHRSIDSTFTEQACEAPAFDSLMTDRRLPTKGLRPHCPRGLHSPS